MKVAVLGHRGMLGRRVMEVFPDAVTFGHRYTGRQDDDLIRALETERPDWVVNCIGDTQGGVDMWAVNSRLPHRLALRWKTVHPSTDHIDDDTDYARSKRIGEVGTVIFRCAIVDPDGGMLARARERNTPGARLREWNGITARTWAALARTAITEDWRGLVVPGSPTITHHELLETARRVFGWKTHTVTVDGREWKAPPPTWLMAPIEEQLRRGYHDHHPDHRPGDALDEGRAERDVPESGLAAHHRGRWRGHPRLRRPADTGPAHRPA